MCENNEIVEFNNLVLVLIFFESYVLFKKRKLKYYYLFSNNRTLFDFKRIIKRFFFSQILNQIQPRYQNILDILNFFLFNREYLNQVNTHLVTSTTFKINFQSKYRPWKHRPRNCHATLSMFEERGERERHVFSHIHNNDWIIVMLLYICVYTT